ncbi:MAG: hypothetical protein V8R28_22380 [Bacteroides cellulosilyticus]
MKAKILIFKFTPQVFTLIRILENGECRQVVWMPQSKDASLDIKLKEAATVVVK